MVGKSFVITSNCRYFAPEIEKSITILKEKNDETDN